MGCYDMEASGFLFCSVAPPRTIKRFLYHDASSRMRLRVQCSQIGQFVPN